MLKLFNIFLLTLTVILAIGLGACYWDRGWLTIENAADLFSIVGSVAVVVSLLFIAYQVKQQTKLARASNSQSLVNGSSDFVIAVASDSQLMDLYSTGGDQFESLNDSQRRQYKYLVGWWLTFYENVQYQQDCGLLDEGVYNAWRKDMIGFIQRRRIDKVWDSLKNNYSDTFIHHFELLINESKPKPIPPGVTKPIDTGSAGQIVKP